MGGVCPIVLILELSAGAGVGVGDITLRSPRSCLCGAEGGIITVALVILPANIRIEPFSFVSAKAAWTAAAEPKPIKNAAFSVSRAEDVAETTTNNKDTSLRSARI